MKKQKFFLLLLVCLLVLGIALASCEFNIYDGFHVDVGGVDVGGIDVGGIDAGGNNGGAPFPDGTAVEPNPSLPPAGPGANPPVPPAGPGANLPVPPVGPGNNRPGV